MRILSVETCNDQFIEGYVEEGEDYRWFCLLPDNTVDFGNAFPKRFFNSIEQFTGMIEQFDPYAFVLEQPIEIDWLDFAVLRAIFLADKRFRNEKR